MDLLNSDPSRVLSISHCPDSRLRSIGVANTWPLSSVFISVHQLTMLPMASHEQLTRQTSLTHSKFTPIQETEMEGGESHLLVESHINSLRFVFVFYTTFIMQFQPFLAWSLRFKTSNLRSLILGDPKPYSISGITMLPLMSRTMVFSHKDIEWGQMI